MVIFHGKMLVHQRVPQRLSWCARKSSEVEIEGAKLDFHPAICSGTMLVFGALDSFLDIATVVAGNDTVILFSHSLW